MQSSENPEHCFRLTYSLIHFDFSYLSDCSLKYNYNDVPLVYDPEVYPTLRDAGIKELTAKHVAHLFIRFDYTTVSPPE